MAAIPLPAGWREALAPRLRGEVLRDEPLAPRTSIRVGGPADLLVRPADPDDLAALLAAVPAHGGREQFARIRQGVDFLETPGARNRIGSDQHSAPGHRVVYEHAFACAWNCRRADVIAGKDHGRTNEGREV